MSLIFREIEQDENGMPMHRINQMWDTSSPHLPTFTSLGSQTFYQISTTTNLSDMEKVSIV